MSPLPLVVMEKPNAGKGRQNRRDLKIKLFNSKREFKKKLKVHKSEKAKDS